jgi:hypothetical protein
VIAKAAITNTRNNPIVISPFFLTISILPWDDQPGNFGNALLRLSENILINYSISFMDINRSLMDVMRDSLTGF